MLFQTAAKLVASLQYGMLKEKEVRHPNSAGYTQPSEQAFISSLNVWPIKYAS